MSQVFLYSQINHSVVLLFKDSIDGTADLEGTRSPDWLLHVRTNQKAKRSIVITRRQWPRPLIKIRSRNSEAASPNPHCIQRDLEILTSRRSEARRPRWMVNYELRNMERG